jgi:Transposase.
MKHSISEVAMRWGFSCMTISRVHYELISRKTSNLRDRWGQKNIVQEQDQRQLKRIVQSNRSANLPQIAGPSTSVSMRTIRRNIIDMGFQSRRPTRISLLTAQHKALRLAWARQHRHCTVDDWKHVAWCD